MKASQQTRSKWQISKAGSLKRLRLISESIPDPAKGEVQIKVYAIGLNFADIFACLGLYSATPTGAFTPGLEFSGTVAALGKSQKGHPNQFQVGDRVMGTTRFGAYASHINIDQRYLTPLPAGWSFEHGAATPVQGLTAWYGLQELGNLSENQTVLVQSAAGGVGLQAMEIIKKQGACAIAVVGSAGKIKILREKSGIDPSQIIVRSNRFKTDLQQAAKQISQGGFDIIFDAVYGKYFKSLYQALNPMGRYILYGAADMMSDGSRPNYFSLIPKYLMRTKLDPLAMISENKGLLAFNLIWLWNEHKLLRRIINDFMSSNPSPPYIGHQFDFMEAPDAMRFFQTGQSTGKITLNVTDH